MCNLINPLDGEMSIFRLVSPGWAADRAQMSQKRLAAPALYGDGGGRRPV